MKTNVPVSAHMGFMKASPVPESTSRLALIIERSLEPLDLNPFILSERVAHLVGELSAAGYGLEEVSDAEPEVPAADIERIPEFVRDHQLVVINTTDTPDRDGYIGPHRPVDSLDYAEAVTSNTLIPNKTVIPPWYWDETREQSPSAFMHRPMLDIDFPAALIPSSTPGHFHLYLDKLMTWEKYSNLLVALREAGILEPGYVGASQQRAYTSLRLPWVKKGASKLFDSAPAATSVAAVGAFR